MMNAQTCLTVPDGLDPLAAPDAFSRADESDDDRFYQQDRFVGHIDAVALETVKRLIGGLVIEPRPVMLDLMAGWDSHLPDGLEPARMVGLGLNPRELAANAALGEHLVHDLNQDPALPFPDETFDVVLNTVSVDYLTRPVDVFRETARILKPGGLFLVVFSNRMFPQKAVKIWRESGEEERVMLVEEFFRRAGGFGPVSSFVSRGRPRPKDDKYAGLGLPSDPVFAVYAEKAGGDPARRPRPEIRLNYGEVLSDEELARRKARIRHTLECPYCGETLKKWAVPENPFAQTWDNEFMYICFNDACPYYVRGYDVMQRKGKGGNSYRLMYIPEKDCCLPVPVPTPKALRESIVD